MKLNYFLGTSIALFAFQASADWSVHESCRDIEGLLEQIVNDVVPQMKRAVDELEKQNINKDVDDLAKKLFGTDSGKRTQAAGYIDQAKNLGNKVDHSTVQIPLPVGHVTFFCGKEGAKTHQPVKVNGQDAVIIPELHIEEEVSNTYKALTGQMALANLAIETKAVTFRTVQLGKRGSFVWIAQGYFEQVKKQKYKSAKDITKEIWDNIAKNPKPNLLTKLATKKPMDALALFDMTIIHELMHTDLAGGAKDADKSDKNTLDAYGWKNCNGNPNGYHNADSLAFFVQGVTAIFDHAYRVKDDGYLEKIAAVPKMLLRRWIA